MTFAASSASRPSKKRMPNASIVSENSRPGKVRIENRIAALLTTQGVPKGPSLRSWRKDMEEMRAGPPDPAPSTRRGEPFASPPRDDAGDDPRGGSRTRAIGDNFAAVLTREVFYRSFQNRWQIASYLGLAPTPFQSGGMDRDRRISRAGNARARKTLIQLAWLWLRYQPDSSLACWFRERVGNLQGRTRRIAIVAMARKLLIAIWRYATDGIVPAGAQIPRFRWVTFNRGRRLVHEAFWLLVTDPDRM
jgi:transposase